MATTRITTIPTTISSSLHHHHHLTPKLGPTPTPTPSFIPTRHPLTLKPITTTTTTTTTTTSRTTTHVRYRLIVSAFKTLSDSPPISLTSSGLDELLPEPGVYAVYDPNGDLQFVGLSRNVSASVASHLQKVPDLCFSVKVGVVDNPDRESLTKAWKSWLEEHIAATGKIPPGNETGNTTWFRAPPKKKPDLRLTPGRHMQLTVPLEELIDKLVKENKVVAFIKGSRSSPLCGFSQRVVGILDSAGVEYESVDVLDEEYNSGLRETLKKYSNWPTFPQIFVNGDLVGGCDILTSMYESGELASLFRK